MSPIQIFYFNVPFLLCLGSGCCLDLSSKPAIVISALGKYSDKILISQDINLLEIVYLVFVLLLSLFIKPWDYEKHVENVKYIVISGIRLRFLMV